ncbi:interleukin-15 receptor subunit alpha isoform 2-T2 [Leptodactylus fuscus]|uniref:interleukin-15 receptor subunit alpha isoform X2 n=1 Tax=Leptodactylus fuscus TaxID=238119 RepID=UPI003F4ED997
MATTLSAVLLKIFIVLQLSLPTHSNQVCSVPKRVKNTKMFSGIFEVNSHLRYICEDGYKRQVGTSNLAICQFNDKTKKADWKYGNISCIRDPLISITTPGSTKSLFTTSVSSSSHASTSPSTTVEEFTRMSLKPTVKLHETLHSTQETVKHTAQNPGRTLVNRLSTVSDHLASESTHSPGLQLYTQTLPKTFPKATVQTKTEITVSTYTTVTETTGYTVAHGTITNFITPVQTRNHTDTPTSIWQKTETIATAGGALVVIILVAGVMILVWYRRRGGYPEDTQTPLQNARPQDNSPVLDMSHEENEEDSFL